MNLNHLPVARKLWALVLGLMISMLALLAGLLSYSMHIDDDAARVVHFNEERIGLALRWKSLNHLQHQHGGTGVLQFQRVLAQCLRRLVAPALHAVAAQRVHGLRRQAQVRAHGNAALDQKTHRGRRPAAAFQLDHVRAGLHQHGG